MPPATGVPTTSRPPSPLLGISPFYGGFGFYASPWFPAFGYGDAPVAAEDPGPDPFDVTGPTGGLRLRIEPKGAQVFVDGYYAGIVDELDGRFHHLDLAPGPHHVEVRAPGYEPLAIDIVIQPHHTMQYLGALARSTTP